MNVRYLSILILLIFVLSFNSINAADIDSQSDIELESAVDQDTILADEQDDVLQSSNDTPLEESGDESVLGAGDDGVSLNDVNSDNEASKSSDLSIQVISNNPTAKVGDRISFDVIIKNVGNIDLTGVYILDLAHDGLIFDAYAGDKWERFDDKYEFNETLKVGQTEVITIFFIAEEVGTWQLSATVGAIYANNDRAFNVTKILDATNEDKPSINNESNHIVASYGDANSEDSSNEEIDVSKHATGNPILLSLLSLMFLPIRRFL